MFPFYEKIRKPEFLLLFKGGVEREYSIGSLTTIVFRSKLFHKQL